MGLLPVMDLNLNQLFSNVHEERQKFNNFAEVSGVDEISALSLGTINTKMEAELVFTCYHLKVFLLFFFFYVDCLIRNTGAFTELYFTAQLKKPFLNY